jgi:hypothetical protein
MADYIPFSDLEFDLWQGNLIDITEKNLTAWDISSDKFAAIKSKQSPWKLAFSTARNKQNRTSVDVQTKNDALKDYKKEIRSFVAENLSNNSLVTNSDRAQMGLTVKSSTHTAAPVPSTFPMGTVDFSLRWQHILHFNDQATPLSKAKPAGVHGCEIWAKVGGEAPKDPSELSYLGIATTNSYMANYDGKQTGTTVHYWLRWVNTRGEHGPWSNTISAMIVG